MDVLTYDEIRMIEREERDSTKITGIDENFLDRFKAYEEDKLRVLRKSDDNVIARKVKERTSKELANARNSFKSIFELRARKIFNQALTDIRMGVEPDTKSLLGFEKELYMQVRKLLEEHFSHISKGKLKKEAVPIKDKNTLVRFIKDLPAFAWGQMSLGPFKEGDIANLPKDVAGVLLKKGAVKAVLNNE